MTRKSRKVKSPKTGEVVLELYVLKNVNSSRVISLEDFDRSASDFEERQEKVVANLCVVTSTIAGGLCVKQVGMGLTQGQRMNKKYIKSLDYVPPDKLIASLKASRPDLDLNPFIRALEKAQEFMNNNVKGSFEKYWDQETKFEGLAKEQRAKLEKETDEPEEPVRKVKSAPALGSSFMTPRVTRRSLRRCSEIFDSTSDVTLSAKEKRYLNAVAPKEESPTLVAISKRELGISQIDESVDNPILSIEEDSNASADHILGAAQLESARYPINGEEYLDWIGTEEAIEYFRKIMHEEIPSARHNDMMRVSAIRGRIEPGIRLRAKLEFLDEKERNGMIDIDIRDKLINTVLRRNGKPPSAAKYLYDWWLDDEDVDRTFAENYASLALNPEGLVKFISKKYGVSKEKAEEEFQKLRLTEEEKEKFCRILNSSDPKIEKFKEKDVEDRIETLEELRKREGEEVWSTLPDLDTSDEDEPALQVQPKPVIKRSTKRRQSREYNGHTLSGKKIRKKNPRK